MCKKTPSDKAIRATFIACHHNKYQISAINEKQNHTKILQIIH